MADFEESCIAWRKSTASNTTGCVEVAVVNGSVLIRDSADRNGVALRFLPVAWSAFVEYARSNDSGPGPGWYRIKKPLPSTPRGLNDDAADSQERLGHRRITR